MQKILVTYLLVCMSLHRSECKFNVNKILNKYEDTFKIIDNKYKNEVKQKNLRFSFSNCGPSSDPMKINSLIFEPDPLPIPGNLTLSVDGFLEKDLNSPLTVIFFSEKCFFLNFTFLKMTLKIIKIVGPFKVEIPCIDNVGSCTYSDVCTMLPEPDNCPAFFREHQIPCTCPFPSGEYSIKNVLLAVETSQKIPNGEYNIISNFQSKEIGHVGCIQVNLKIA